jgi:hypothetical protein
MAASNVEGEQRLSDSRSADSSSGPKGLCAGEGVLVAPAVVETPSDIVEWL